MTKAWPTFLVLPIVLFGLIAPTSSHAAPVLLREITDSKSSGLGHG